MAVNNGVNDRVFHRHDRWKSEQAEDTCVDDDLEQRLEVLVLFGDIISPSIVRLAHNTFHKCHSLD